MSVNYDYLVPIKVMKIFFFKIRFFNNSGFLFSAIFRMDNHFTPRFKSCDVPKTLLIQCSIQLKVIIIIFLFYFNNLFINDANVLPTPISQTRSTMLILQVSFQFIWMMLMVEREVFGSFGKKIHILNHPVCLKVHLIRLSIRKLEAWVLQHEPNHIRTPNKWLLESSRPCRR